MSIESRKITLHCPICGNDQFSSIDMKKDDLSDAPDDSRIQCADCKSIYSKAEILERNHDIIDANIEELKQEAIEEIQKELKKIFK